MTTHYNVFPVGDYSGDGHAYCAYFLVSSDLSIAAIKSVHAKHDGFLGNLCKEYEENTVNKEYLVEYLQYELKIPQDEARTCIELIAAKNDIGLTKDTIRFSTEEGFEEREIEYLIDTPQKLCALWVDLLNALSPVLNLKLETPAYSKYTIKYKGWPHKPEGSMESYGPAHLTIPGYGVFGDSHDAEFYLDCN